MARLPSALRRLFRCPCFHLRSKAVAVDPHSKITSPEQLSPSIAPADQPRRSKETVVVIAHGAFQTTWHYESYMDAIRTNPSVDRALCPQQSSSNPSPNADSFHQDIRMLNETVVGLLEENNDVLLVCHSYGGIPGCEALGHLPEPIEGCVGKLVGIVFVSAFVAEPGQSLVTSKMQGRASWVRMEGKLSYVNDPVPTLFNMVECPSRAEELASHLVPQASVSFTATTTSSNWKHLPCCYIRCLQDKAMLPQEQDHFITRLRSGNPTAHIKDLEADHSPFASAPHKLAELTATIVEELKANREHPQRKKKKKNH